MPNHSSELLNRQFRPAGVHHLAMVRSPVSHAGSPINVEDAKQTA
jgi:hypothetical protein